MARYVEGQDRTQSVLFPERLDDWTRTLPRVRTEMSLQVLAYNLKRAIKILGAGPLMAAMKA